MARVDDFTRTAVAWENSKNSNAKFFSKMISDTITGTDEFNALHARILKRDRSMFADDLANNADDLRQAIGGARIMVIGAAGSTGAAFVRQLIPYLPGTLDLIDINENNLVELVRDLRSSGAELGAELRTASIDFGGEEFCRFADASSPYDIIANFSALKHVRAERDPYSLMRMIDVNVRALHDCFDHIGSETCVFSVSTDKSVRPENLMGATKALMENVLFCRDTPRTSTARFANVAFSAGSLLEGFGNRLAKDQPISAPSDVRRYMMSQTEAGQLCLMAAFLADHRNIYYPALSSETDLVSFAEIAEMFLEEHGYRAIHCTSEEEAKALIGTDPKAWPCYFSASDTTGEKAIEEFTRDDEFSDNDSYRKISVLNAPRANRDALEIFLAEIAKIRQGRHWDKDDITAALRRAVPDLRHEELGRSLDAKM
jgi:FlaA1/EpsC-like NDP-sugar epimerase